MLLPVSVGFWSCLGLWLRSLPPSSRGLLHPSLLLVSVLLVSLIQTLLDLGPINYTRSCHLKILNLMHSQSPFFQIRSQSQVPGVRRWAYVCRDHDSTHHNHWLRTLNFICCSTDNWKLDFERLKLAIFFHTQLFYVLICKGKG